MEDDAGNCKEVSGLTVYKTVVPLFLESGAPDYHSDKPIADVPACNGKKRPGDDVARLMHAADDADDAERGADDKKCDAYARI